MKKLFPTLCLLLLALYGHAQIIIRGNITDEAGAPVPYAAAALVQAADSLLVKGSLADDAGAFLIEAVPPGQYRLQATSLGYAPQYSPVFELTADNKTASIDLRLEQRSVLLDEAVVVGKRPFLEQKADRLVVNVDGSALAAGGTAMEILQKVPGVVILQDRVTLGGSQNVQVWIDGKPSPYTDMNALLRDMPGDQIDKIELITRPGAQFDAAGGPILNVVLKRNANLGFKGTVGLTLGGFRVDQSDVGEGLEDYGRVNPSANMTYRSGKVNLSAGAAYNRGNTFDVFIVDRFIGEEVYKGKNLSRTDYAFGVGRLGLDYYASEKTTVGGAFRAWGRSGRGPAFNRTEVFDKSEQVMLAAFITENETDSQRRGSFGNLFLKHEFDRETGRSLNVDFDYNTFYADDVNTLRIYLDGQPEQASQSQQAVEQPVRIAVGKADYIHPVDSTFKIETGLKSSFATVDNSLSFFRGGLRSEAESNDFLYEENINAAYVNISKQLLKFEFNAGLRAEQTVVNGTSAEAEVLDRNYLQLFPSASALYRFNDKIALQSSYSRRVNRPSFQQQNPFSFFIDSLTYTRGNPALRPEIINTAQLLLTYEGQPFFGVSYYKTDDVIIENAPRLEGTRTFTTAENLATQERLEIQLNFPITIGKVIDGFAGNQAIYNAYDANYLGDNYQASRWHWLAYWQINAKLPAGFKLELGGFYLTKFLEEFLVIDNLAGVNLGVSKSFHDERGSISLAFNDIFYSQNTRAVIDFADVRVDFFQREFSRNLRLSVRYQFGNTNMKNAASRSSASQSEAARIRIE